MEKNGKNGTFFYKERKRTERSFLKNGKQRKERNVLLKRTNAQPWITTQHVTISLGVQIPRSHRFSAAHSRHFSHLEMSARTTNVKNKRVLSRAFFWLDPELEP